MTMLKNLAEQAHAMLEEQKQSWPTLRDNAAAFLKFENKIFEFDNGASDRNGKFKIIAQHNPARLYSVSAKVDPKSVGDRKCFLCDANRPIQQRSLRTGNGYKILCNPFPILPEHFTIVKEAHEPQRIGPYVGEMLDLTAALSEKYSLFYNGPQCGASAPDHMHFQAGTKGFLPADAEYDRLKTRVAAKNGVEVFVVENYLRRVIAIESSDRAAMLKMFDRFCSALGSAQPQAVEPMMNVMCSRDGEKWRLIIFPRSKHRPSIYYSNDDSVRMMISPGSVDISGLVVMPIANDFARVKREHLVQTYDEVTISAELFAQLIAGL